MLMIIVAFIVQASLVNAYGGQQIADDYHGTDDDLPRLNPIKRMTVHDAPTLGGSASLLR
jgi:hypothetical protein